MRFFILENKQDLITEGANLGVSTSLKNKIVLYPTPTHNQLNIESQTHFNQLNIYNSIGVLVLNKRFTPRKTLQIDLTYLNSALYFLNIQDNEQILSKKKFIKN